MNSTKHFFCSALLSLLLLLSGAGYASAQKVALKTNLGYWATISPNMAVEARLGDQVTVELGGGVNFWNYKSGTRMKHWLVQPELRLWTCDAFNGHFFGFHIHGGQYNVGGLKLAIIRSANLRDYRYQGGFYGAGLSYGYQWVASRHWNIEASLGAGYTRFIYAKYTCEKCGTKIGEGHYNYWGVTRGTLSLVYLF